MSRSDAAERHYLPRRDFLRPRLRLGHSHNSQESLVETMVLPRFGATT